MIVLDTNVLSELMRPEPAGAVLDWIDAQADDDLFISAITMAEILHGIARLPGGRRKDGLHAQAMAMFEEDFADHILPFDAQAAQHYARLVAAREASGKPIALADAQIAAICREQKAGLATRNVKDFVDTGVSIINPWSGMTA